MLALYKMTVEIPYETDWSRRIRLKLDFYVVIIYELSYDETY